MPSKTISLICRQRNALFVPNPNQKDFGETKDNLRYHWTDELEIRQIEKFSEVVDEPYWLEGESDTMGKFRFPISGLRHFKLVDVQGNFTHLAFSKSLIASHEQRENEGKITIEVELWDSEPLGNPIPGIYLALTDFPEELK